MSPFRSALLLSFLCVVLVTDASAAGARRRSVAHPRIPTNALYTQGGYADETSVRQGSSINFRIATAISPFTLEIINLANENVVVQSIPNLTSQTRDCTGMSSDGCKWPVTTTLDIPTTWPSGYYAARFPVSDGIGVQYIFFVVRENQPASTADTLVIVSTHTYQAYNSYGNLNVYPSNSPRRAAVVSFDRPYHDNYGLGRFPRWDKPFLDFLTANNIPYEVATDSDLEEPTLLSRYNLLVLVGHSEYWTSSARRNVEAFNEMGGHIAVFGGNTMWWQIRLADDDRKLITYKDAKLDPETGRNNQVVTVNWFAPPVYRPENLLFGASFRNSGYTNRDRTMPLDQRKPYTVANASSWVFSGTGLQNGAQFGHIAAGGEVDGAIFNCNAAGLPAEVDGSDGTPLNFQVLAAVPSEEGYGIIGMYTSADGGTVFNAASQDWSLALASDPVIATITKNVLQRLSTGERMMYEPVQSQVRLRDFFNCAMPNERVLFGWRGDEGSLAVSSRCGYEGPTGLELGGKTAIAVARTFSPTGNPVDHLETRFYINADAVTGTSIDPLLVFHSRPQTIPSRVARIEFDRAQKRVRLVQYNPDNTAGNRTDWINVANGWHSVQAGWRSPGILTLQVDAGPELAVQNPNAGQTMNELQLFVPADPASTNGYLCIDALAAGLEKLPPVLGLR
ncbi:MAG TPA: N,N-dimethylformamidase beta subunit family domain-containing protein [Thermoanaerobaculia bacterium]|jgi:hypothetical protein